MHIPRNLSNLRGNQLWHFLKYFPCSYKRSQGRTLLSLLPLPLAKWGDVSWGAVGIWSPWRKLGRYRVMAWEELSKPGTDLPLNYLLWSISPCPAKLMLIVALRNLQLKALWYILSHGNKFHGEKRILSFWGLLHKSKKNFPWSPNCSPSCFHFLSTPLATVRPHGHCWTYHRLVALKCLCSITTPAIWN